MNKKERKRRLWKANFKRQYQKKITDTVQRETGLPAECCCVFIAHLAERLAQGKLKVQFGVLVIDDQGPKKDPLVCAHCWNVYGAERLDLSPWGNCPYRTQYLTPEDGEDYRSYLDQLPPFGDAPKELLDADIDDLLAAMDSERDVINPIQWLADKANISEFSAQNSGWITT